ncbi:MAG: Gfo/Idh/MocA family protein [Acetivibrionales bacterium]|jgi:predicted dehydrogenase
MKRFRIAIAGCGLIANEWVKYALTREDVEIVALVDVNNKNAKAMAQKYQLNCECYEDIEDAIRSTGANLVFDTTIVMAHKDIVVKSIKAGCDVFGEKPMAFTMEEAVEMVSTAAKYGKVYSVMQNRRFTKGLRAIRQLIDSGALGKASFVCADIFVPADLKSIRNFLENPMLQDNAIHTFDQARFITGMDAISVYCHNFSPEGNKYKGHAAAECIFELSDGSVFSFRGWMGAEGCHTSWESAWRIACSKGTLIWDGFSDPYYEIPLSENEKNSLTDDYKGLKAKSNWNGKLQHEGCLEEMFTALIEGRKAETDCIDNIRSMAMVFAAIKSFKEERKVKIIIKNGCPHFE